MPSADNGSALRAELRAAGPSHLSVYATDGVQPFCRANSAEEYSVDGVAWQPIHAAINVLGSRYALAIRQLRKEEFDLPLAKTKVALGNSMGSNGDRYIAGRVDKACLEITEEIDPHSVVEPRVHIGVVAEIVKPYAVYVRNSPPK